MYQAPLTLLSVVLTIYAVAAVFVIRAAYCRLARTSRRTDPFVRANFVLAAAGQIVSLVALMAAGVGEVIKAEALAIGITAISISSAAGFWLSSHRWRQGPPPHVQQDEVRPIFPWQHDIDREGSP